MTCAGGCRYCGADGARPSMRSAGRSSATDSSCSTPDTAAAIDLPVAAIGSSVRVLASGIGDSGGPVEAACAIAGTSVRPPSPAQVRVVEIDGASTLTWARRSRAGFRWIDGGDVPLAEESESYRVSIAPPAGPPRDVVLAERSCALESGEAVSGTIIDVRQIGTFGESPPARLFV